MQKKYRIVEHNIRQGLVREFYVQEKKWFRWRYVQNKSMCMKISFNTKEEAIEFIDGGCKDPYIPTVTYHPYVGIPYGDK